MHSAKKPAWPQATALVSLSTCGAMTGFTFAHGTVADMTSPTNMPVHLMALDKPASPASSDRALRAAIVSVTKHYLQLAQSKTPAEMEALIWQADSIDSVDHGPSCAAFASLALALGAQAVGQQSWVTGGGSYPWPLHRWADVRVQPNPASPDVESMLQDAQAHHRWHPLGDGYQPQSGDWVLFDGHVEVVTRHTGAALYTVGGDSLPNLTVNAHKFLAPFTAQGVLGFVNNGELASTAGHDGQSASGHGSAAIPGTVASGRGASGRGPPRVGPPRVAAAPGGRRRARPPYRERRCWRIRRAVAPRAVAPRATTLPPTAGTTRRLRACRVPPPSKRSSAWWRRERSRRSNGTASRPRSPSPRPSTNRAGGKAGSPRRTTTCSASREPARPAATCGRRGSTRTASGLPAPHRSGCTTTSRRASRSTAGSWPRARHTSTPWPTARCPTRSPPPSPASTPPIRTMAPT